MPTLTYNRSTTLPIIDVTVSYHALEGIAHPSGKSPQVTVRALIDTGATHVVLQPKIVQDLGLIFAGKIENTVVGGEVHTVPGYAADIIFGDKCTNTVTDVLILSQALSGYDMLIGWDVLRFSDWSFVRNGTFSQSW